MSSETTAVVLYSGGPDSFISLEWARRQGFASVIPLYVNLGHRYQEQELEVVAKTEPRCRVEMAIDQLGLWEESDAHIFGRNAFLCLVAAKWLPPGKDGTVVLSVQMDETSIPDRTPEFVGAIGSLLETLRPGVVTRVMSPWWGRDKTEMVKWYLENGGDVERLKATHSCYKPVAKRFRHADGESYVTSETMLQCGDCPACFRRAVAFGLNNVVEQYATDPFRTETAEEYRRRALAGEYSEQRCHRILTAMGIGWKE